MIERFNETATMQTRAGPVRVELLPARVYPPPAQAAPLPAHWPRGGAEGEKLVAQLRMRTR